MTVTGNMGELGSINSLYILDRAGKVIRHYLGPTNSIYEPASVPMMIRGFDIVPGTKDQQPRIAVACISSLGLKASCLVTLDPNGSELSTYWHPGQIAWVKVASETDSAKPKIIVAAINNHLRNRFEGSELTNVYCLFSLDPDHIGGEAPPYQPGRPRGTQEWYLVFQPAGVPIHAPFFADVNGDGKREICLEVGASKVCLTFDGKLVINERGDNSKAQVTVQRIAE
jgi:hypothetical protein